MTTNSSIAEILNVKGSTVWTVPPTSTVYNALEIMAAKNIGALCVVDGGRLLGILSERDYARKVALKGKTSRTALVREIVSDQVVSITLENTIEECLHLMTDHRVRHLPVLEDGKLTGLVSIGDLVNHIISTQRSTIEQLQTYISGVPG